ncbi:MAG: TOBE domain-containing protein [Polaromonas sp.]|nr:TOBE domain-containing protein [Polaromonas sp.]
MQANDSGIALRGAVWMTVGGANFGGPGRIALLASIGQCGSITQAAKAIKMSYKAAWDAVDTMNNLAGEPLVERLSGGKGGGGTRLTPRGRQLVSNFQLIELEHRRFVDQLSSQSRGIADDFLLIRKMHMKTSARNHFSGQVTALRRGAVNDEVEVTVAGGQRVVAIITCESTQALGLCLQADVFALVKSSSVIVVANAAGAKFSARNQLSGIISRLQPGVVNTEVVIGLPGGGSLAAIITHESAVVLGLAVGGAATGIFKASSVILGISD